MHGLLLNTPSGPLRVTAGSEHRAQFSTAQTCWIKVRRDIEKRMDPSYSVRGSIGDIGSFEFEFEFESGFEHGFDGAKVGYDGKKTWGKNQGKWRRAHVRFLRRYRLSPVHLLSPGRILRWDVGANLHLFATSLQPSLQEVNQKAFVRWRMSI
jgi:hypothetical protein